MAVVFEVPVSYLAEVREFQKRNHMTATFLSSVCVSVTEITGLQAPVVMQAVLGNGSPATYRDVDGVLLRSLNMPTSCGPCQVTDKNVDTVMADFSAMVRNRDVGQPIVSWPFMKKHYQVSRVTTEMDWQQVYHADSAPSATTMHELWNGARCIDGDIYVLSQGPYWGLSTAMDADDNPIPVLCLEPERGHIFGLSQWVFPPQDLLVAESKIANSRSSEIAEAIGIKADSWTWNGVMAPRRGDVWGPALDSYRADSLVGVSELTATIAALLKQCAVDLADMKASQVFEYANLKQIHDNGIKTIGMTQAVRALRIFHASWMEYASRTEHSKHADLVSPLLARLDHTPDKLDNLN